MFDRKDFIKYIKTTEKVDGIGTHLIVEKGTVKHTFIDDDDHEINIILHDAIHVPTLDVSLLSV